MTTGSRTFLKAALLLAVGTGLSGCVYDVGLGFASDGYFDGDEGCDPYNSYAAYYDCDYRQGFGNIGFGGGWYDSFYYPGYGFFVFDQVGRRYPMRDHHRRYWGEKRHHWYRERRGRDWDRDRHDRRVRGDWKNTRSEKSSTPDRHEGRTRNRDDDRRDGRRNGNNQGHGGDDASAAGTGPLPHTGAPQGQSRPSTYGDRDQQPERRGRGASNGGANSVAEQTDPARQYNVVPVRQVSDVRPEPQRPAAARPHMPEGGVERPD
jgi:hypothetical protein